MECCAVRLAPQRLLAVAVLALGVESAASLRAADCDGDQIDDTAEIASGAEPDCNGNGVPDACDIARGASRDAIADGIPDECQRDCNGNAVLDEVELEGGAPDCDGNGVLDECDLVPSVLVGDGLPILTAGSARAAAAGDFDGDGDLDLAVSTAFALELHENLGGRRFSPWANLPLGSDPAGVAAADLDGDGDVDVATVNLRDNASVLLNRGDGALAAPVNMAVGQRGGWIVAADLDGDGDGDLGLASATARGIAVLFGRGDGSFEPEVRLDLPGDVPRSLAAADVDGDGAFELVVGTRQTVVMVRSLRAGDFEEVLVGVPTSDVRDVTAGDLDGDSDLDLAVASANGIHLFENLGNGELTWRSRLAGERPWEVIVAADVGGEGGVDLLARERLAPETLRVFSNRGDGSFAAPIAFDVGRVDSLEVADLDGDRSEDLIAGGTLAAGSLRVHHTAFGPFAADCNANGVPDACDIRGEISFRPRETLALGARRTDAVDLDGDGRDDLVASHNDARGIEVLLAGSGAFAGGLRYLDGESVRVVVAEDLDGNGALDLVVGGLATEVVLLRNDGSGLFSEAGRYATGEPAAGIATGDLDGDGRADVAVATHAEWTGASPGLAAHVLGVWSNLGGGVLALAGWVPVGCCPGAARAADLDADGDVDIVVRSGGGSCTPCIGASFTVLLNDGSGNLTSRFTETPESRFEAEIANTDLADMTGDGLLDLVTGVHVYPGRGDGRFGRPLAHPAGRLLATADVEGDGTRDLLVDFSSRETGRWLVVLRNRGDGVYLEPVLVYERREIIRLAVGDFDGDSDADVAVTKPGSGDVTILVNDSVPPSSFDFDRDGVLDECGGAGVFHRGDPNADGRANVADAVFLLRFLFVDEGVELLCAEAADADNDGRIVITDPIALLEWLFRGGPPPAAPGPPPAPCGADPDEPGSAGDLGCERYNRCAG